MKQFAIVINPGDGSETTVELVSAKKFVELANRDKIEFEEKGRIATEARQAADDARVALDAVPAGEDNTAQQKDFEEKDRIAKAAEDDKDAAWIQCETNAKILPEVLKAIEEEEKEVAEKAKYRQMIEEIAKVLLETKGGLVGLAKMLDDINTGVKNIDARIGAGSGGGVAPKKTKIRIIYFC